jgi:hypothetical protein
VPHPAPRRPPAGPPGLRGKQALYILAASDRRPFRSLIPSYLPVLACAPNQRVACCQRARERTVGLQLESLSLLWASRKCVYKWWIFKTPSDGGHAWFGACARLLCHHETKDLRRPAGPRPVSAGSCTVCTPCDDLGRCQSSVTRAVQLCPGQGGAVQRRRGARAARLPPRGGSGSHCSLRLGVHPARQSHQLGLRVPRLPRAGSSTATLWAMTERASVLCRGRWRS